MSEQRLTMKFDPLTIEHLGVRLYSTLPPVLAELIANAYDADATRVHVNLKDDNGTKEIVVEDDGMGMVFSEINGKFLKIGRNRRDGDGTEETPKGRMVIGKKGLGKLSFFGISREVEISTKKDGYHNVFRMKWSDIESETEEYHPEVIINNEACSAEDSGTVITLRDIQRVSDFQPEEIANSLSKMFIIDEDFKIFVELNNSGSIKVENEGKYRELDKEIEWEIPADLMEEWECEIKEKIVGHLIATKKPISPKTNMRGITLFSRKKLVNNPEYFSESESSHFFSYLTGWLEVDYIDDLDDDVIATNRQALNWGHPEMEKLKACLQKMINWLEKDWRRKRADIRAGEAGKRTGMSIGEWREHIPENIKRELDPIISSLLKNSEMPDEELASSLKGLQKIVKPYPRFHWLNLHPKLSSEVFEYYRKEDYYGAVFEGVKRYIQEVKNKTGSALTDRNLLENIFAISNSKWSVTKKFKRPNGNDFHADTTTNITEGHQKLAIAMWQAFRDPISHDPVKDLRDSGLYTEQDCLDALGLLSHLFRRLDNAETV